MRERVVVVGAGGMGREAAAWLLDEDPSPELLGFVDDEGPAGREVAGHVVLGARDWVRSNPDVAVVVAVGNSMARRDLSEFVASAGARLRRVVHPTAYVGPGSELGPGCIVCPGAVVSRDVRIDRGVIVNFGAAVGHDGHLGDHATVGPGARIAGNVEVGACAEVGIGAVVLQGRRVGAAAQVGAGAVVTRDVPDAVLVVGVPARRRPDPVTRG